MALDLNAAYKNVFGRPADAGGLAYWNGQVAANPNMTQADLEAQLKANARGTDDQAAAASTSKTGWQSGWDLGNVDGTGNIDFVNGQWTNGKPAPVATPATTVTPGAGLTPPTASYTAAQATPALSTSTGYTAGTADAASYDATTAAAKDATSQGYTAAQQADAVKAEAAQRTINPTTDTVQGQISGIIAANSPLMQQARATALQQMNDRGLINSSIAVGAGQNAVINAAMPIATSDAGFYNTAGAQNQQATNTANLTNAAAQNTVNATNTGATNTASQFTSGAANQAGLINAQLGTDVAEKNAAATTAAAAANANAKTTVNLANAGYENAASAFGAGASNASSALNAQLGTQTSLTNANAANAAAAANADAQNKAGIVAANNLSAQTIATMTTETQKYLADTQAKYQTLISTSGAAATLSNSTMTALNAINESTLDPASKQTAYNAQVNNYNSAMNLIGSINGVDVTKLLTFQTA